MRQKNPACRCASRSSQKHSITQFHLHNLHYITFSFLVLQTFPLNVQINAAAAVPELTLLCGLMHKPLLYFLISFSSFLFLHPALHNAVRQKHALMIPSFQITESCKVWVAFRKFQKDVGGISELRRDKDTEFRLQTTETFNETRMERLTCESAEGQGHGWAGQRHIKERRERRQTVKTCHVL